jgi:hypothetical protein
MLWITTQSGKRKALKQLNTVVPIAYFPFSSGLKSTVMEICARIAPPFAVAPWDIRQSTAPVVSLSRLNRAFRARLRTPKRSADDGRVLAQACEATFAPTEMDSSLCTGGYRHRAVDRPCVGATALTLACLFFSRTGQVGRLDWPGGRECILP